MNGPASHQKKKRNNETSIHSSGLVWLVANKSTKKKKLGYLRLDIYMYCTYREGVKPDT